MALFSDKVIQHLRFAKNWLDRAEEEFSREQILEAELTLSLAEAEVRHAWETSRGTALSTTLRVARQWRQRLLIGLVIVLLVWGGIAILDNRSSGYPDSSFLAGQLTVPGRWDNQLQYKIILDADPQQVPAISEHPSAEPAIPQVPQETALPKAEAPSDAVQTESVPTATQPAETEVVAPVVIEPVETELAAGPSSTGEQVQAETIPIGEAKADANPAEPPQINLGKLFKIANDALKGE